MATPNFQSLTRPLLRLADDGVEHSLATTRTPRADQFGLSDEEQKELQSASATSLFSPHVAVAIRRCSLPSVHFQRFRGCGLFGMEEDYLPGVLVLPNNGTQRGRGQTLHMKRRGGSSA